MAVSPEDVFIREVDEEVRRDQLASFWTQYGRWLLIAVGLVLILLAAFLWWREGQVQAVGQASEQFSAAQRGLELGAPEAQAEIDRFASGDFGGYTTLAQFTKAQQAAANGDSAAAIAAYAGIAGDTRLPQPLRDLATIQSVRLQFDDLPPAKIVGQLRPLAKPGAPWFGVAGEMLALAHVRDGKPELAGPVFAAISRDETIAPSLRQRAQQMAASLGALAIPDSSPDMDNEPVEAIVPPPAAVPSAEKN